MSEQPGAARGRPKSATKKQQIFEAAVRLFMRQGFGGTSVDDIAAQAGVSKQTIYSHFGSKDELFRHCVISKMDSYELNQASIDPTAPLKATLLSIAEHFTQLLSSPEAVGVKQMIIAESDAKLAELFYEAGPARMKQILTDYLREQSVRGRLKIADHYVAACQFLFMLHGEAHMCALMRVGNQPSDEQVDHYIRSCVEAFLRAYAVDN